MPPLCNVYPRGKYREVAQSEYELSLDGLKLASGEYSSLNVDARSRFDDCLLAYYTAVALIAALTLFRRANKCSGSITCSQCGPLDFRHDTVGESTSIANSLCDDFGLEEQDTRRVKLQKVIRRVYRTQRSAYVHEAVLRHDEFGREVPLCVPTEKLVISPQIAAHNELVTLDFLTRRALLQHLAKLANQQFDSGVYGMEPDKFELTLGSMGQFVVGSNYQVAIRAMGRV